MISYSHPNGNTIEVDEGTLVQTVLARLEGLGEGDPRSEVLGARVNNQILSLNDTLEVNGQIEGVPLASPDGVRIYRRSLCFLLAMAAHRLYPDERLIIGHSLGDSYYYFFEQDTAGTGKSPRHIDLRQIESTMRELVDANHVVAHRYFSYTEALVYLQDRGLQDTAMLLSQDSRDPVPMHLCDGYMDLAHGVLVPRLGVLQHFALEPLESGFCLRFPSSQVPNELAPKFRYSRLLFSIYKEYKVWGRILGVRAVGSLNERAHNSDIRAFIRVNEALQDKKIAEIADRISEAGKELRLVLIAGPSSSGKTTFSKKLGIQLQVKGLRPVAISLDDYFVEREATPRDEEGNYDFESLHAIDLELFNDQLLSLFRGERVSLPTFDFKLGRRVYHGRELLLDQDTVLIVEGIHGLNDELTARIPSEQKFRIYVSALTQLNLDDHNRISTTDNRLIRRLVRDYKFRGHNALATLRMWPSVGRGENRNIFPFQDSADVAFNSALDYELSVLKNHAVPILNQVKPYDAEYSEARRILGFLRNFVGIPEHDVPQLSILREFIGGSSFSY